MQMGSIAGYIHSYTYCIYAVIFEGHNFRGFLKETMYQCIQLDDQRKSNRENPSDIAFHEI